MDLRRPLTQKELQAIVDELSGPEPFSSGSSDNYEPGEDSESDSESSKPTLSKIAKKITQEETEDYDSSSSSDSEPEPVNVVLNEANRILDWTIPDNTFQPAKTLQAERPCSLSEYITKQLSPMQIFHKLFPNSLYIMIVDCTNQRLDLWNKSKKRKEKKIDKGELQKLFGCMFIMSYNNLPGLKHYWSQRESMGNRTIEKAISRDRFMILSSKLYFAPPEKPPGASKTYYVDELISCLTYTYSKYRQDSQYQSIDESMTKFKGRSSLKQYMPLKPTKRGIKLWLRCDAKTGYTYDINVYSGKESTPSTSNDSLTLGERVVKSLASTIKAKDVVLCFDRFFTSVHLLETIRHPALGTCMANRKNIPPMTDKLKRGQSTFRCSNTGLLCTKWQDTKDVMILSNCHKPDLTTITKKNRGGEQETVECPEVVAFYRQKMGGVDRADQLIGLYQHDRKSTKWWKKVFYTCLTMSAVNAWIMYNDLRREKDKISFLSFLVDLAEELITEGLRTTSKPPPKRGPPSKKRKLFGVTPLHLPVEGETRRRCARCAGEKLQKRTKTICKECNIPLCKECFLLYHTK